MHSTGILKMAGGLILAFGATCVVALFTPLSTLLDLFLDLAHFPLDGQQKVATKTERLLVAIMGGLCCGLGAIILLLADYQKSQSIDIPRIIAIGALAWFAPDCLGSVVAGAWFNVVLNSGFFILLVAPYVIEQRALGESRLM